MPSTPSAKVGVESHRDTGEGRLALGHLKSHTRVGVMARENNLVVRAPWAPPRSVSLPPLRGPALRNIVFQRLRDEEDHVPCPPACPR
jgi:hypothetical protein